MSNEAVVSGSPTFAIGRSDLLADAGRSEIEVLASSIVRSHFSRLVATFFSAGVVKRFDIWIGEDGIVTHASADAADETSPGMVAALPLRDATISALIVECIGGLPASARPDTRQFDDLDELSTIVLNSADQSERLAVIGRRKADGSMSLVVVSSDSGGGSMATGVGLDSGLELLPSSAPLMWAALVDLLEIQD